MFFWYQMVQVINTPISLMVYAMGWPYVFVLFGDLNAFVASVLPIVFIFFIVKILYSMPWNLIFKIQHKTQAP